MNQELIALARIEALFQAHAADDTRRFATLEERSQLLPAMSEAVKTIREVQRQQLHDTRDLFALVRGLTATDSAQTEAIAGVKARGSMSEKQKAGVIAGAVAVIAGAIEAAHGWFR